MPSQRDLVGVLRALHDAANRYAIDEVMAMSTNNAEFEIEGETPLVGKSQIRSNYEYDAGVNVEIELINAAAQGDVITCQVVERSDRLRLAGIDELRYVSCVVSFKGTLIRSIKAVPDPVPARIFDEFWERVKLWIAQNYPAEYGRMYTQEGEFIRNRENGECAVRRAREYRSWAVAAGCSRPGCAP